MAPNRLWLIVGKSGVGKTTLANLLAQNGMPCVLGHTTRPKRSEDDTPYTFVNAKTARQEKDKAVTSTSINGYDYYTTVDDIEDKLVAIVDPKGVEDFIKYYPHCNFRVIYIAANETLRKTKAIARAQDPIKEEAIFDKRNQDEKERFNEFEKQLNQLPDTYDNIHLVYKLFNDYNKATMETEVLRILATEQILKNTLYIFNTAIEEHYIKTNADKTVPVTYNNKDQNLSPMTCVDLILNNPDRMFELMQWWLSRPTTRLYETEEPLVTETIMDKEQLFDLIDPTELINQEPQ